MITLNERPINTDARRDTGLLGKQVARNMADVLSEYGGQPAEQAVEAPKVVFGYGIPMAGVRYYTFTQEA